MNESKVKAAYYSDAEVTLYHGDAMNVAQSLPDCSVNCIVTSPPYFGLRDYGIEGQYGLEKSPVEYVENLKKLFSELRRALADNGTLWLNIGDSYSRNPMKGGSGTPNGRNIDKMGYPDKRKWREGSARADGQVRGDGQSRRNRNGCLNGDVPEKNLLGIPWRVAFALQDDGWILRNAIIWNKPNAMPESVTDRLSKRYEHIFLLTKNGKYWFNLDPIREDVTTAVNGRVGKKNPGDVWNISTRPFPEAHFATFPVTLPERCILAGCEPGGTVLDPFSGSGTTGLAAVKAGRKYVGIDISAEYLDLSLRTRLKRAINEQ